MRKYVLLIVIAIAAIGYGGQKCYVYFTNTSPTRMTCRQYLADRPAGIWLELSDCVVDYQGAIQLESKVLKVDKGVYIPVRPQGDGGPAMLLLKMKSADAEQRVRNVVASNPSATRSPGGLTIPPETVSGLVQVGLDSDDKARRVLKGSVSSGELAEGYKIIEADAKPEAADAMFGAGLILAAVVGSVVWWMGKRKRSTAA